MPLFYKYFFLENSLFKKTLFNRLYLTVYSILYSRFKLRKNNYDIVIVPRWDFDAGLAVFFAYFTAAKIRIAYSENVSEIKKSLNKNSDCFYTHLAYDGDFKHEVERNLFLLKFFGIEPRGKHIEIWHSEEDALFVKNFIAQFDSSKVIAVCPAASHERRKWKNENYQALIDWIISVYNFNIAVIGGRENANKFIFKTPRGRENKLIDFRGKLTIRQTAALLKSCSLYIGNDTGPMHKAAAAGIKVVELSCQPEKGNMYHSQSPKRFAPWGVEYKLLQPKVTLKPCPEDKCVSKYSHCINNISIEQVKTAAKEYLDKEFAENFLLGA